MKRNIFSLILLAITTTLPAAALASPLAEEAAGSQQFARGADISWYTEMEADGRRFYDDALQPTELNALMRRCGMNAVRLRVWVDPVFGGQGRCPYAGGWCGTDDTVQKALAAKAEGLDVLIDFHYSDFFADPSRQAIPAAWQGGTIDQLAQHVSEHTTAVLSALKAAGVTPRWVQLGNETRGGMLYSQYNAASKSWTGATAGATGSTAPGGGGGWGNYVALSNAGYDAAKAVFPDVVCMSHLDTRGSDTDLSWWFKAFVDAGGKLDMVGLSHYPMPWNAGGEAAATTSGKQRNAGLMTIADRTHATMGVPLMVVETGVYCEYTTGGREVMQDLFDRCRSTDYIRGIFYWEPEQYGWWKPAVYATLGWDGYNMCGFLSDGRPSPILDPWQPTDAEREAEAVGRVLTPAAPTTAHDLQGRLLTRPAKGVQIEGGRKVTR